MDHPGSVSVPQDWRTSHTPAPESLGGSAGRAERRLHGSDTRRSGARRSHGFPCLLAFADSSSRGSSPLRSAFAVSRDLDGLLLSEPPGVFQPVTLVEFGSRGQGRGGVRGAADPRTGRVGSPARSPRSPGRETPERSRNPTLIWQARPGDDGVRASTRSDSGPLPLAVATDATGVARRGGPPSRAFPTDRGRRDVGSTRPIGCP